MMDNRTFNSRYCTTNLLKVPNSGNQFFLISRNRTNNFTNPGPYILNLLRTLPSMLLWPQCFGVFLLFCYFISLLVYSFIASLFHILFLFIILLFCYLESYRRWVQKQYSIVIIVYVLSPFLIETLKHRHAIKKKTWKPLLCFEIHYHHQLQDDQSTNLWSPKYTFEYLRHRPIKCFKLLILNYPISLWRHIKTNRLFKL